jgi:cardiolipin synthase
MDSPGTKVLRELSDEALTRAAGAFLIPGNRIKLLKDASENYPAWIDAIKSAEKWIHFETFIIHEDEMGRQFADLLAERAEAGVKVRLVYDWAGAVGNASRRFWRNMMDRGIEVRCFNPPGIDSPLGWINRDHRKMIGVDGRVAFVTGLCVGQRWVGYPERGIDAWRDTGVEIEGPAVAEVERAFADVWAEVGAPLTAREIPSMDSIEPAGNVGLRVVATVPNRGPIYRVDQLIATLARKSIWLSDAYFLGTSSYVQALGSAAQSGVDVRLLIPSSSDVPVMRALSRAGLRPLLDAGVRVFEWNGSMMHAKTAVADGQWARVGSTNLNLTSWLGNWELDVIVENERFARRMEEMYQDDLSRATEIVLGPQRRRPIVPASGSARRPRRKTVGGSTGRAAAGVLRISNAVGAAVTNRRKLGPAEAVLMIWAAAILTAFSVVAVVLPEAVVYPLVVLCMWVAVSLFVRGYKLRRRGSGRHSS